jgi:hypothetical protein
MEMGKFSNISLAVLELNYAEKHMAGLPDKLQDIIIPNSKNKLVA